MRSYSTVTAPQSAMRCVMAPKSVSIISSGSVSSSVVLKGKRSACSPNSKNSSWPSALVQRKAKSDAGVGAGGEVSSVGKVAVDGGGAGCSVGGPLPSIRSVPTMTAPAAAQRTGRRKYQMGLGEWEGWFGVPVSSVSGIPSSRLKAIRFFISGAAASVSHLLTAWRLTPNRSPKASWLKPNALRPAEIRFPMVMEVSSLPFLALLYHGLFQMATTQVSNIGCGGEKRKNPAKPSMQNRKNKIK